MRTRQRRREKAGKRADKPAREIGREARFQAGTAEAQAAAECQGQWQCRARMADFGLGRRQGLAECERLGRCGRKHREVIEKGDSQAAGERSPAAFSYLPAGPTGGVIRSVDKP